MAARVARSITALLALPDDQRQLGVFQLVRPLGKGGFAPVWLAREVYGGTELRTVAVKLFALDDAPSSASSTITGLTARRAKRDQIVQEARALCQVEHPNIVRFFAIATDGPGNVLGLAMEYVHGTPVDQRLEEKGHLEVREALAVGSAIASALVAVHQVGLVHRDIKPGNVVDAAGVYKLIDFGIAAARVTPSTPRASVPASPSQLVMDDLPLELAPDAAISHAQAEPLSTLTGSTASLGVSGTTGYADPACVASAAPPTPASDLYSLGATIFECIVGSVPAVAAAKRAGARGLDQEVLEGRAPAPSLADVAADVPESLARIVDALLAADPAKRPRSAEAVAWELERIRREIAGRSRPLPPEERGPFRGLARFDSEDRDVYFGRSIEIAAALEMTRTRGLVALVGPSGSGKSSLARAGLLPAIADGELGGWPKVWDAVVLVPGSDPRAALGDALGALLDDPAASTRESDALVAALADRAQQTGRGVVLLVDQLEELVTLGPDAGMDARAHAGESRAWAVSLLARLGTQAIPGVRCVVAARRDLLDGLLALGELGRALTRGTLLVAPLTDAAWEEVLDHALGAYDYALEDAAMREALLTQLHGTSSAMPLVQFALTELWARRDALHKTIPRAALDAIGGIGGALEMHADATLAKVGTLGDGAQAIARDVLLALTTTQGTRATRTLADLGRRVPGALTTRVVSALADARILVGESDGLTLAHEALLTRWDTLRRWIAEAKDDRVRAEELEREAAAWVADARSPDRLLKKRRLRAAEELAKEEPRLVGDGARDFLHAGRRAERRAAIVLAIPVALAAVVIAGFALARWDAARIKVSFCGNSVTRWQVQECVEPIREAERAHRGISQRFYTQGGRVVKVERLNSAGELRADDDGYASYAYRYDDAGKLTEIVYADRLGQIELREIFSDELRRRERRDQFGIPKPMGKSDSTVTKVEYDERGFLRASRFLSTYGSPRVDELHAYGYALKADALGFYAWSDALGPDGSPSPTSENIAHASRAFDAVGNQIEQTFLDLENKPAILSAKYSTWRAKYDAWGNEIERSYFDSAGSLTTTRWGYARYEQKFDDRGNRVLLSYFDTEGKLAIAQDGYAGVRSLFDAKGNETELEFFGTSGEPSLSHDGYAKAKLRYDDHGNAVETSYFGLDGKPRAARDGEAALHKRYDARGNEIEVAYFGVDDVDGALQERPMLHDGAHLTTVKYDERDNAVEVASFGVDGKPIISSDGFARRVSTFDERGKETATAYFGVDDAPLLKDGYARVTMRYDERGNAIETAYFGVNGKPVLRQGGYSVYAVRYDERGNRIDESYLGTDLKPAIGADQYFRRTLSWDDRGKQVSEAYFGTDDKPLLRNGIARWTAKYDARGRETETRAFGTDGKPITRQAGYSWTQSTYDDRGNRVHHAYFAVNDKPALHKDGIAGWRAKYGPQNVEIERTYFGVAAQPVRVADGYVSTTSVYDRQGNVVERAYFGEGGAPTLHKQGYWKMTARYDDRGNELERAYFGTSGEPTLRGGIATRTAVVDERGNETEVRYLGIDGKPALGKEKWARSTSKYDHKGNKIETASFGVNDEPVLDSEGHAMWRASFDERGHAREKAYFGVDGKLVATDDDGFARSTSTYDDRGNETERAYFGADDKPVAKDGAARWLAAYDDNGRRREVRYFGVDGDPKAMPEGYARMTLEHDVYGHVLATALFDASDRPASHTDGWSSFRSTFDPMGNEIEKSYFGQDGKPVAIKKGFARSTARYDEGARELERSFFGADDRAAMSEGFARSLTKYDERGHVVEAAWFGADGRPVVKDGYAKKTARYDRQGQLVEEAFYGKDGKLAMKGEWAKWTGAYDDRGKRIESAFFGPGNTPLVLADGYARFTKSFDERGKETETRYFGRGGELAPERDGVAISRRTYDDWGNEVARAFFGADGKPTLHTQGIASWRSTFDPYGNEIERAYFGKNGEPAVSKGEGCARWVAEVDAHGNEIASSYFGVDGRPVLNAAGFARVTAKYEERDYRGFFAVTTDGDDPGERERKDSVALWKTKLEPSGKITELAFFGKDGEPVVQRGGYARVTMKYDPNGNLVERAYFDVAGAPARDKKSGCASLRFKYDDEGQGKQAKQAKQGNEREAETDAIRERDGRCFDVDAKERKRRAGG